MVCLVPVLYCGKMWRPYDKDKFVGAVIILVVLVSSPRQTRAAPIKDRTSRDLMQILKDAGKVFQKAGETALRTLLPKVMNSGLIPGMKPNSQKATQPYGPKIPLNTLSEYSISPVIPNQKGTVTS